MDVVLFNSLSKKLEPLDLKTDKTVGIYTCGPTVYDFVTIGNWRTYFLSDIAVRTLIYLGYDVSFVMNITDVGHLTGDNDGDADTGIDRMEKAKIREKKGAYEIAQFYTKDFLAGYKKLNLSQPKIFAKATEHIEDQINLIKKLEKNNLTYKISDGIYFNTEEFEKKGFKYGELSNLDQIKKGARVEFNQEKKNERDFALWKFSPESSKRDMEWESPWGIGFPGWHIECSAMSMKYLGEQFDIHVGGEDLKSTHHPNEIAQAEGATGLKPFVKYWLHGAFLRVDGGKMGKSLNNAYNLKDIEDKGFSPLVLRYFYLNAHYRSSLNFTWEGLESASTAFKKAHRIFNSLEADNGQVNTSYQEKFKEVLMDDLNMPKALALLWDVLKDDTLDNKDKRATILDFDKVLGLSFGNIEEQEIPINILELIKKRDDARKERDWQTSDKIREELEGLGYIVSDSEEGTKLEK